MTPKEETVFKETRKRNLKRRLSKLSTHPDLKEEYLETKKQLQEIQ